MKGDKYSFVEHLAKIVGGIGWNGVLMSAFTCYFDTSGTQHDQLALTAAGFMSTADQWLDFEIEWKKRLAREGMTAFHRTEIKPSKHPGLLEDLASIIRDHVNRKFSLTVRVHALHRLVKKTEYDKWHLDAYSYANRGCAAHVRIWAQQNHLRSMPELIFATGDTGRSDLEHRLKVDGFTNVTFRPALDAKDAKTGLIDPAVVPLQAADLFAYELFSPGRQIEKGVKAKEWHDFLTPACLILDKIPGEVQVTSDANLSDFTKRVKSGSVK
jgi:hypothetical protein